MTEEAYDELWNSDWVGIPDFPYVMKYRFDENGYILMVSDLAAVYAEKLNEKAIQERFQNLNPYAEMLPKVILKHVKHSIKKILAGEQAHEQTDFKIIHHSNKVAIQHQFNTSGVRFMFNFELQKLSDNQFKEHILRPTLLRALIIGEEKAALQRKVEELEGRQSFSSSNGSSERRNIKAIYSEMKGKDPSVSGVIHAFLYLQKDKIALPESLEGTPNVSPIKGIHSSSTSSFTHKKIKDSKNKAINIPYEEGDSDMNLESQNTIQQSEEAELSLKTEKIEDNESIVNEFDHSSNSLSVKTQNGEQLNKHLSPMKREMANEDSKEENVSKPAHYLKPSNSKKKKLLKF
ncbi:unnamed protein product [Larinioides sclopetarius]|uniref:Non-homologous end-joining factor 1 n=1 Tax=Larinioides sclopetarius TaxID=280406 RepID=A0AAV1YWS1_9ARAC